LENGQYNKSWKHIHMMPNEVLQAAKDLGAKENIACAFIQVLPFTAYMG
jgi:ABC-type spermidine/putrescine transport system permease subunit I